MRFYVTEKGLVDLRSLKIASIKYYDAENNGVLMNDSLTYVILQEGKNPPYINILDMLDETPVLERLPYSNITEDGLEYGSKVRVVSGLEDNLESGPCYIVDKKNLSDYFSKDFITNLELEEFIVSSKFYFRGRSDLVKSRLKKHPIKMMKVLYDDFRSEENFVKFFEKNNYIVFKK